MYQLSFLFYCIYKVDQDNTSEVVIFLQNSQKLLKNEISVNFINVSNDSVQLNNLSLKLLKQKSLLLQLLTSYVHLQLFKRLKKKNTFKEIITDVRVGKRSCLRYFAIFLILILLSTKVMLYNLHKVGFHTGFEFISNLVVNFLCGLYCLWLLFLARRYLWSPTTLRMQSGSTNREKEQQSISQTEMKDMSISISSEEKRAPSNLKKEIKIVATLYIFICCLYCFGSIIERSAYGFANVPGKACPLALYVAYLRVFIDGLFFSFYLVRATVILEGSVFALSLCSQYFFGIAPIATFGTVLFIHQIHEELNNCTIDAMERWSLIATVICQFFWNIALFGFLVYHLLRVLQKPNKNVYVYVANHSFMPNDGCQNEVKEYFKKLLRLFLVTEFSSLSLYIFAFTPALYGFVWSAASIDLCVNCTTILLSFAFAQSAFERICLCKKNYLSNFLPCSI
ncbi:hypothetical protein RFI_09046 [Reticulomyxa filosa]|uniref:Uncharacterized protein n=1 Tax=Reticulomyxa filosa TaxID=46433 RepID=X6NPZ1_RETFI|nr:hypothetical protein RFI_09046 [Reticulomyxa filosa]|eukprot:ETO28086.1 hypothetical protein RFI_09046 [Reticulomyxa filosa]